jgi:hypothetical protein
LRVATLRAQSADALTESLQEGREHLFRLTGRYCFRLHFLHRQLLRREVVIESVLSSRRA